MKKHISLLLVATLLFSQNSFVLAGEEGGASGGESSEASARGSSSLSDKLRTSVPGCLEGSAVEQLAQENPLANDILRGSSAAVLAWLAYKNFINPHGEPFRPIHWSVVTGWPSTLLATVAAFGLSKHNAVGDKAFDSAQARVGKWQKNELRIGKWGASFLEKHPKAEWASTVPVGVGLFSLYYFLTRTAGWKYSMAQNYYATQSVLSVQRGDADNIRTQLNKSTWAETKSTLDAYEKRVIKARKLLDDVLWKAGVSKTVDQVDTLTGKEKKLLPEGFVAFAQQVNQASQNIAAAKKAVEPRVDTEDQRSFRRVVKWSMLANAISNTGRFCISSVRAVGSPEFRQGLATIGLGAGALWLCLKKL